MVRECRPPAREPGRAWLARRSTIATSTPANASSPANISPVGPPPAITTAWSVIATFRRTHPSVNELVEQPARPDDLRVGGSDPFAQFTVGRDHDHVTMGLGDGGDRV